MRNRNLLRIFVLIIISMFLYSCPPEVNPNGDITGIVTDAETSESIQAVLIKSMQSGVTTDTTRTLIDGTYLLENLVPGDYEIQASKFAFSPSSENIEVIAGKTKVLDFTLPGLPITGFSDTTLNFELDLTSMPLIISNRGKGKLTYALSASQNWITLNPS